MQIINLFASTSWKFWYKHPILPFIWWTSFLLWNFWQGKKDFENIPKRVENDTVSTRQTINDGMDDFVTTIEEGLSEITKLSDDVSFSLLFGYVKIVLYRKWLGPGRRRLSINKTSLRLHVYQKVPLGWWLPFLLMMIHPPEQVLIYPYLQHNTIYGKYTDMVTGSERSNWSNLRIDTK